ncbi:MAG TPA: acyl carrier protein [Candidatus Scybalocola faecigallinarum]|uniref:Acyl carrier protein n=1 Tax=Candidatus Scybalocola faecigallinarum TaxID=2840941 RepID=A0A9D1F428_9FIRM|nr:acyl carrier protein [Candidatus Scybalocola faecigallinarum]
MLEKMRELIADQLNVDPSEVVESATFEGDLGADSLDLFELVMNLEEEYGIEIPTEDLETLKTVGDVMNYLKDHGIEE